MRQRAGARHRWATTCSRRPAAQGSDNLGTRRLLVRDLAERIVAAVRAPTLLAFDDLQWAGEVSLEVIGELARLGRDVPLLLLGAYRADELPVDSYHREWRARLLSQRLAEEARLSPLTFDQTAMVTTLILGTGLPAPREVVKAIYERTDGIPLHIEELLGALDEEARQDGRAIRDAVVPDTIEDAILARAARLSPEAREVARAGAVIGRCFDPGGPRRRAGPLAAGPRRTPCRAGRELVPVPARALSTAATSTSATSCCATRCTTASRPPSCGACTLERASSGPSWLARRRSTHRSTSSEPASSQRRSAPHSQERELPERCPAGASRSGCTPGPRRTSPRTLPAIERAKLYDGYFEAASAVDDVSAMVETARLARHWYLEAGRPAEAAAALLNEAGVARRDVCPASERLRLLDQVESELRELADTPERTATLSDLRLFQAMVSLDRVKLDEAAALLDEARSLWLASGNSDTRDIDYIAASVDVLAGRTDTGMSTMLRIARDARESRIESTGVTAYRWLAAIAIRVMDYATAEIGLSEGLRYADAIEQSYCRHVLAATAAHVAWAHGRWDDAILAAEIEIVERGSRRGTLGSRDALGFVAFGRGQVERARTLFNASLAIGADSGEVELTLPATWGLAETARVADEPATAIGHCEEALRLAVETGERPLLVPFVVTGVRAHLAARRPDAAERWLSTTRSMLSGWEAMARPALDHADGLIRLAAGSTVAARASLEAAIEGWDARPRTWEATWARLDLAACLIRANRAGEALPILRDVSTLAERIDSPPMLDRAQELARLARSRGAEEEPWRPLSAREFEIAGLVSEGLTNVEVATRLHLSSRTVSAHVEHILAKLGVGRRSEIAAWVITVRPVVASAPSTTPVLAARR